MQKKQGTKQILRTSQGEAHWTAKAEAPGKICPGRVVSSNGKHILCWPRGLGSIIHCA
jgi:hypothetical protein